jgi:hypothetical protein
MYVPDLNIPSGLEESYFKTVAFGSEWNGNVIRLKRNSPAKKNYSNIAKNSLFVRWEYIWDGFTTLRKNAWHAFWGGYPGSGYSAFIQINAPRYQAGLDLLLDPPGGANLLFNSTFFETSDPWVLNDGWVYSVNSVKILNGDYEPSFLVQALDTLEDSASYHISFKFRCSPYNYDSSGSAEVYMYASVGSDGDMFPAIDLSPYADGLWHTIEVDRVSAFGGGSPIGQPFKLGAGYVDILDGSYLWITDVRLNKNP